MTSSASTAERLRKAQFLVPSKKAQMLFQTDLNFCRFGLSVCEHTHRKTNGKRRSMGGAVAEEESCVGGGGDGGGGGVKRFFDC